VLTDLREELNALTAAAQALAAAVARARGNPLARPRMAKAIVDLAKMTGRLDKIRAELNAATNPEAA